MRRSERSRLVLEALRQAIPLPVTELAYGNPFELLVAVILSAQCTDRRVNEVTPALFEAFPTAGRMAQAEPEEIYPFIRSVSYPNSKSRHLAAAARLLVERFGGEVPSSLDALMTLPGVGRKTAQVVAGTAFDVPALPVDTHVFRVANRIGLADRAPTSLEVERQLKRIVPRAEWGVAHHLLLLHGRYTCTARNPRCEACPVTAWCRYYERLAALPPPVQGLDPGRGKYYCTTSGRYFDEPALRTDRHGVEQIACPYSRSTNVFLTRTGASTRRVKDYRVNGD